MKKDVQFPQKEVKKNLTVRIPPSLRMEAEAVAKANNISLAVLVETGIRLVVESKKARK